MLASGAAQLCCPVRQPTWQECAIWIPNLTHTNNLLICESILRPENTIFKKPRVYTILKGAATPPPTSPIFLFFILGGLPQKRQFLRPIFFWEKHVFGSKWRFVVFYSISVFSGFPVISRHHFSVYHHPHTQTHTHQHQHGSEHRSSSAHQHINTSKHQHIYISPHQRMNTSVQLASDAGQWC